MVPHYGTIAQIDPKTGQVLPANIVVPPSHNLFTLPTSLVSSSLVQVPGVGPAP